MRRYAAMLRQFAVVLLVFSLCVSLSACRESAVLHEVIYEQATPDVDDEQETLDPEDEGENDEQFENEQDDLAETERDAEEDMGLKDPSQSETDSAMDTGYDPSANGDWQSPSPAGEDQGQSGSQSSGTSETTGGQEMPDLTPGDESAGKQIVDASGRTVTLPEQVKTVTAVRWGAQMVEMLGGSGRLAAADADFLSTSLAQAACSDLGNVEALWSGGGSSPLSADRFSALLALAPDVCFEISGEHTFSSDQIRQMEDAGITYVVLPALTDTDMLKQSASLIAAVLGTNDSTGENSSSIAAAYGAWVDGVVSDTKGSLDATGLYVADWDASASYVLSHTKGVVESQGSGLAMAYSPKKAQLVSAFMKAVGLTNESTRLMSTHRDLEYVYVTPMFHQFDPAVTGTRAAFYSGAGEYGSAFDLFVARMVSDSVYYQLGSAQFPAVIAANAAVKEQIEKNWFWQYHETDANGYVDISGESFYCGVVGEYRIYVNPQGMCSWAEGSVESPLEAYWLRAVYGGGMTMEQVRSKTSSFYQQFFGVSLSKRQLDEIFAN